MRIFSRHFFQDLKLKQKIWVLFTMILIGYLVGMTVLFYFIMRNQIDRYAEENNRNTLITIGNNLSSEIDKVNNFSRLLLTNEGILAYLNASGEDLREAYSYGIQSIYSVQNAYPEACSVFVFRNDNDFLSTGSGVTRVDTKLLQSKAWRRPLDEKKGGYVLEANGNGLFSNNWKGEMISLVRNIIGIDNFRKQGILAVNIPISALEETYSDIAGEKLHFCYMDETGKILCQDTETDEFYEVQIGEEKIGQQKHRGLFQEKIYSYYKIPKTGLTLVCLENVNILENIVGGYILVFLFFLFVTIMAFFMLQIFMSIFVTTPIQKMVDSMGYAREGFLKRVSMKTCNDEIGQLKDTYNKMLVEMNNLINQLLDKEKQIRSSEVEIIQQQIKPHFLYNTIEMIACMALDAGSMEMYDVLETLGSFYRKFLSRGDNEVSLETEVDIIRNYLKLEKYRYEDIFDTEFEVEPECLKARVPKLLLQPLIENSLYHGIRLKGERGIIRIHIWKEEKKIYIEISDTGVGMSKEQLAHIMKENSKSFGFKRTIERLQYYENREDVYEVTSEEGKGTKIRLNIISEQGEGAYV